MPREDRSIKELVVERTKSTGVVPCIKLTQKGDCMSYAKAMYEGGARVIEVTMTTPGALEAIEAISEHYRNEVSVAAGTVLDPATAREVMLRGGSLIVNPAVIPDVIDAANRYQIPIYSGAFTSTEVLQAMRAGSTMIKVCPASFAGPKYLAYLKMIYPQVMLCPSGGITLDNAAEFIRCGAAAVSGMRTFMDHERIAEEGIEWVTRRVARFIEIIAEAKRDLPELP